MGKSKSILTFFKIFMLPCTITCYICIMDEIWNEIISKPKWYAGILNENGIFYNAQSASKIKSRYRNGTLSETVLEKILTAHGYILEKKWVKL